VGLLKRANIKMTHASYKNSDEGFKDVMLAHLGMAFLF